MADPIILMKFWSENVDKILDFNNKPLLTNKGSISNKVMEEKAREIYAQFDKKRKTFEAEQADMHDLEELKSIENRLKEKE